MTNQEIYEKYDAAGIYCIKIDNKIIYIGQAKNMRKRIKQHISAICASNPKERKYQILHNAWANHINITFDVLEYTINDKNILTAAELKWISEFTPPLNTAGIVTHESIDTRLAQTPLAYLLELTDGFYWE